MRALVVVVSINRYATKRDGNESAIVDALKSFGATVVRLDTPVDLLVGYKGVNYLIEIKLPEGPKGGVSHATLTSDQVRFFAGWRGKTPSVVRNPLAALEAIGVNTA